MSAIQLLFVLLISPAVFASRLPHPVLLQGKANKIASFNTSCDSQTFNITVATTRPFKGVAFARDFAHECLVLGTGINELFLSLPAAGCGVRLKTSVDEGGLARMTYGVALVLQQDRYLRQISDQDQMVHCEVKDEAFLVKSRPMIDAVKGEIKRSKANHRVGRLMDEGWSKDLSQSQLEEELREAMSASRAWMEITPENNAQRPEDTVEVGETVLLTVKSTLPSGIGWRIVDCTAHDGLGDSSQKLLDDRGCPVDEALLPVPKFGPLRPIASMRHQEAVARFAAFKFPDRDRLHLRCRLQICRGACAKVDCDSSNETERDNRIGRANSGKSGEVLDRLEVYNSVEVIAPDIDDVRSFRQKPDPSAEFDAYPFPKIPGDRTFCMSIDKMAIAFCILGVVFLLAVLVAVCSLLNSRRSNSGLQYYTRSLFSNSSSAGSAFGSKLLSQDSPMFGQSSTPTSNRMQYGRIL
uniref:ZP domain-containing protein n=1 Tax=Dendroctonus ponderosae TaxID=77166 RepID=A0AAR5P2C8_DENPD